ncbi:MULTISPECIES: hypothetical protein [Maribacter]|uniref:Uncharacterized protein n=1 Tax=Maribacter flavus TaxID=1658664 RepID=A0ABU7IE50_9FLAO|nr:MULTISPECIES: hypothetical protein [Maribacter]MDC6403987.1 hypothetical protein [Maribacter sp. PR66]MEE1971128.1 hypothetical protein [Maribacter flavus]
MKFYKQTLFIVLLFVSCANPFSELPKEIATYFEKNLHDPNSFEIVDISSSQLSFEEYELFIGGKPKELTIEEYLQKESGIKKIQDEILQDKDSYPIVHLLRYRAKNKLGALALNSKYCVTFPDGRLIGCYSNFDDYSNGIYNEILKPKIEHLLL